MNNIGEVILDCGKARRLKMNKNQRDTKRKALKVYEQGIINACEIRRKAIAQAEEVFSTEKANLKEDYKRMAAQE